MGGFFRENSWRFLHMNWRHKYLIAYTSSGHSWPVRSAGPFVEAITRDLKQNQADKSLTVTVGDYITAGLTYAEYSTG